MNLFRKRKQERNHNIYYVKVCNILEKFASKRYTTIRVEVYNVNKSIAQCRQEAINKAKKEIFACQYVQGIVNYFEYNK